MTDGGELDNLLATIMDAAGMTQKPTVSALSAMRAAVRQIYEAGYNDCAEQFGLGVRIVAEQPRKD